MFIKEQWGIENASEDFRIIWCLLEERFPSNNCKFCDRDFWEHALNYSQCIVKDKNKHFRFE